jgi:hypothetical protein
MTLIVFIVVSISLVMNVETMYTISSKLISWHWYSYNFKFVICHRLFKFLKDFHSYGDPSIASIFFLLGSFQVRNKNTSVVVGTEQNDCRIEMVTGQLMYMHMLAGVCWLPVHLPIFPFALTCTCIPVRPTGAKPV